MSNNQHNNNTNTFLFLAGIAAGAAAGYWLNTQKGKELRQTAYEKSLEYADTVKLKSGEITEIVKEKATSAIEAASSVASNVESTIKDTISSTSDQFQRGVDKAKSKVNNRTTA